MIIRNLFEVFLYHFAPYLPIMFGIIMGRIYGFDIGSQGGADATQ